MPELDNISKHRLPFLWSVVWANLKQPLRSGQPQKAGLLRKLSRRPASITLRHLDCGSCNGCELELNALTNPIYDIEQYGIGFEASPRHAVYLAMTGPFTRGLEQAALRTLDAMPEPGIIAIGDCALGIGPFEESYAIQERPAEIEGAIRLPIPGCPPSPQEILEALAKWLRS